MLTPAAIVHAAAGRPAVAGAAPVASGRCAICAAVPARALPYRRWEGSNFAGQADLAWPGGEWVCEPWFARQDADRTAAKLAAEEAEAVERNSWIAEHGSPRLRRLAAESIECGAVYRDERLAAERPGWEWEDAIPDGLAEREAPRNAPEAALDLLDRARETAPDATLGFVADADHGRGYVASATFLGRAIVLGRDQLVVEPESDEEE